MGLDWELIPWRADTAVEALRQCDVGIMPFRGDQPWNRYKCGLKLIEYMALSLPVVASPVGVNAQIVTSNVNGLLAENSSEWTTQLNRLLQDVALRRRLGWRARETVIARFSVQAWLPKLERVLREFSS
jgi:glycosyltransferase involved in cell wall biosynthesis